MTDTYDPYRLAQQQAYAQAQQQTQDWSGLSGAITSASTPPGTAYSTQAGANIQGGLPDYAGRAARPNSSAGTAIGNDNFSRYPDKWWGQVPQATFKDIIDDPEKFTRMWADAYGLGQNTERTVNNFAPMPVNFLYGMGLQDQFSGPGVDDPMQKQAELQEKFYDRILRGGNSGVGAGYINPRQLMQTALNAIVTKDQAGNYIGQQNPLAMQFGDPAVPPETQADNFIKYVASTVGNLIPGQSAQAYINVLQREKSLFSDYVTKNPTVNVTFNRWISDRLGPNGGI